MRTLAAREGLNNPHLGRNAIGCGSKIRFEDYRSDEVLAGAPEKRSEPSGSRFDVSGSRPRAAHGPRVIRSRSGQR